MYFDKILDNVQLIEFLLIEFIYLNSFITWMENLIVRIIRKNG